MPTETEGMEVRGYEVGWPQPTLEHELRGADWGLAGHPDAPPHHPLVRQSDALALAERAREEGRREAWEACDRLLRVEVFDPDDTEEAAYFDGIRECEIRIRALLTSSPPKGEGGEG